DMHGDVYTSTCTLQTTPKSEPLMQVEPAKEISLRFVVLPELNMRIATTLIEPAIDPASTWAIVELPPCTHSCKLGLLVPTFHPLWCRREVAEVLFVRSVTPNVAG